MAIHYEQMFMNIVTWMCDLCNVMSNDTVHH